MTSSCHRCLGLPTGLVPIGFQSNSFLVVLAWSIRYVCPSHLILCALMNLTISAFSINLSISLLVRILHILSILTGTNIFLSRRNKHGSWNSLGSIIFVNTEVKVKSHLTECLLAIQRKLLPYCGGLLESCSCSVTGVSMSGHLHNTQRNRSLCQRED
jgi:hypothetical protein